MENKINIGELDTLVTLRSVVQTIGTQGEKIMTPSVYGSVWAKVEKTTAEAIDGSNLESASDILLTCYKVATLTTRWQVVIGTKVYEIRSIDPISRWSPLNTLQIHAIDG